MTLKKKTTDPFSGIEQQVPEYTVDMNSSNDDKGHEYTEFDITLGPFQIQKVTKTQADLDWDV